MVQVSAILPVYNEEKYISNCLNSLLAQSQKSLEIIVVDDGSTDSTLKILKSFEKKYSNVRVFKKNHAGPGEARNFGAKQAKGKILVFPDADEEFPFDYVHKLVSPIISGLVIGTTPKLVKLNPNSNIFSKIKYNEFVNKYDYADNSGSDVFRAIRKKEFFSVNGFNTKNDYFDDSSLSKSLGLKPKVIDTFSYTIMSSSPKEIILDSAWGVKSNLLAGDKKPFLIGLALLFVYAILFIVILYFPVLLFIIYLFSGILGVIRTKLILAIIFYPIFLLSKTLGLFLGVFKYFYFNGKKGR